MNFQKNFLKSQRKCNKKDFKLLTNHCKWKQLVKCNFDNWMINDFFPNGLMSLPYGHPCLGNLRKEKQKDRVIHKIIQEKDMGF